jgi:ketosteroid isomerase-like protein
MKNTTTKVISEYVDASNSRDTTKLLSLFTNDAIVKDEGKTYKGLNEIKAWRKLLTESYEFQMEVLDIELEKTNVIVTARLTGNFPGKNPVDIQNHFKLTGDKIIELSHI